MVHQRNQWLQPGQGLTASIDATIRINDARSLRSWCLKETNESTLVTHLMVLLMHQSGSMIQDHFDHAASKGSVNPLRRVHSWVVLMHHDLSNLAGLILIQLLVQYIYHCKDPKGIAAALISLSDLATFFKSFLLRIAICITMKLFGTSHRIGWDNDIQTIIVTMNPNPKTIELHANKIQWN